MTDNDIHVLQFLNAFDKDSILEANKKFDGTWEAIPADKAQKYENRENEND